MPVHDEETQPILRNFTSKSRVKGAHWYEGVFLIVNATLGAGLLNFPQAYDQAGGIFTASILMGIILIFVIGALLILANSSNLNLSTTYQDVVFGVCGKRWQQICSITITVYMFGACITFLVVIGDQFDRVLSSLYGSDFCHHWYMERRFTLPSTAVALILPLCYSRRIDFLKYPSALGVVSALYLVFLVINQYYNIEHGNTTVKTTSVAWPDIFLVVPAICFGFQCHISSVPVYSCLRHRNISTFGFVASTAMIFCAVSYSLVAIFGYLTFGSGVPSDILLEYDANNPIVLIGMVMLAVKTITAFPVLTFCGRIAVDGLWISWRNLSISAANRGEAKRRILISSVWFSTTVVLAVFIPNIGVAIRALGSLAALMIFVFPGWILLRYVLIKDVNLYLIKDRLILIVSIVYQAVGMFIFGVIITQVFTDAEPADKIILCH